MSHPKNIYNGRLASLPGKNSNFAHQPNYCQVLGLSDSKINLLKKNAEIVCLVLTPML
jgi:hypothetical protein